MSSAWGPGPLAETSRSRIELLKGEWMLLVFVVDPLDKHPHDPDIQTLLRICNVRNVPLATNIASADILISSDLFWRTNADAHGEQVG